MPQWGRVKPPSFKIENKMMHEKQKITKEVIGWGKLAVAITAIAVVVTGVLVFADYHFMTPYITGKTEPILKTHRQWDSCAHEEILKKLQDVKEIGGANVRIMLRTQKMMMTPKQRRAWVDTMVNDTTIPRELIY